MRVLAVDPGPTESAFVLYEDGGLERGGWKGNAFGKVGNDDLLYMVSTRGKYGHREESHLVVEMVASYGMPVGAEVFETCVAIGRIVQAWERSYTLLKRQEVKLHLCNSPRANDATIRQALIDRYGGKTKAIGTKKAPGPLYGVSGDVWSALAVAVTFAETLASKEAA